MSDEVSDLYPGVPVRVEGDRRRFMRFWRMHGPYAWVLVWHSTQRHPQYTVRPYILPVDPARVRISDVATEPPDMPVWAKGA